MLIHITLAVRSFVLASFHHYNSMAFTLKGTEGWKRLTIVINITINMNEVYQEMRKSLKEYGKKNINLIQLVEKTYRPFVVKNGHQRCLHIYHKHSLDNQQREIQRLAAKSYLK